MKIKKQTKKWTMKNGNKIRICDMENSHLINIIKMLKRCAERKKQKIESFYIYCVPPNGEMAQDAFDSEFNSVMESTWDDYVPNIYDNLYNEAERRGLELGGLRS